MINSCLHTKSCCRQRYPRE